LSAKLLRFLFLCLFFGAPAFVATAQDPGSAADTAMPEIDSIGVSPAPDSTGRIIISDSLAPVSDTLHDVGEKQAIDAPVDYKARDSIVYSISEQKVYLYGEGSIQYNDILLTADYIEFNMGNEAVFARGTLDSLGKEVGKPEFKEGSETFQCKKLSYNFRTKKGFITDIFTEQEGGYLHSAITKRQPNDEIHMKNGKYTTCDAAHPHFYIALTKAKSIPNDKIVAGPAYIVLEDVPLPIGIPFGFFPSTRTNQSGFLLPTYGEEERRGFYLRNGGFYFSLNDYFDLAITGDIYTNGTWGVRTRSNYKKNYKFNGSFGVNYMENVTGEKGLENYSVSRDVAIRWNHGQDNRANPNQSFRASVDFTTSSYDQNHSHNINNVLQSTKRSSVSYSRVFPNAPFNLSGSMNATQNSQTKLMDLNLPSINFSMNRIYPLRRKNAVGSPRWYEKFQVSYTAQLENKLSTITDSLFTTTRPEDFNNGYAHNIPASLALNFLNYFTFSPSVRYSGVVFTKSIHPQWVEDYQYQDGRVVDTLIIDTIPGFNYAHAVVPSVGLTFTPRIYGMYTFREKSRIEAIRHVVSPSASFSLVPDMSGVVPNYYQEVKIDSSGRTRIYPLYDESVFRVPVPSGRSGSVSLSLKNNVEMKLKPKSDTIEEVTKVKLLDNLNFSTNYNIFKDSMKWSLVRMSGNTSLFKRKVSLRFGGVFNPYAYVTDQKGRSHDIDQALIKTDKRLFRLTGLDFSLGMNFSSKQGSGRQQEDGQTDLSNDATARFINPTGYDEINYAAYVDFTIPWSLGVDYSFRYTKPYDQSNIIQSVRLRGDFSLTPKWKIGFNSGFDFKQMEVTTTNLNIHRDLHCWEMTVSMVPFGTYRSYSFTISIKSAILKDLQYEKGDSWYDNF
jgi:hypothetical protein